MKEIQLLEELLDDEMSDSNKYVDLALEYKESDQEMAKLFYDLSLAEDGHRNNIHSMITKKIEKYRREHGEPPAAMMAVYEFLHKKEMNKAAHLKSKQDMWRQG